MSDSIRQVAGASDDVEKAPVGGNDVKLLLHRERQVEAVVSRVIEIERKPSCGRGEAPIGAGNATGAALSSPTASADIRRA